MSNLTEKELTVIERIGDNGGDVTQRHIAKHTGLSLGLTNIILKRLVKKGYVKTKQLTAKKVQYILTSKGLTEKTGKSYRYITRTVRELKKIYIGIQNLLENEYSAGVRKIGILGEGDLVDVIKLFQPQMPDLEMIMLGGNFNNEDINGIGLIVYCGEDLNVSNFLSVRRINIFDYIAKIAAT